MDFKVALIFVIAHFCLWDRWDRVKASDIVTKKQRFLNLLVLVLSVSLFLQGMHLILSGYSFWDHSGIDILGTGGGRSKGQAFLLVLMLPVFMILVYGSCSIISFLREISYMLQRMLERKKSKS